MGHDLSHVGVRDVATGECGITSSVCGALSSTGATHADVTRSATVSVRPASLALKGGVAVRVECGVVVDAVDSVHGLEPTAVLVEVGDQRTHGLRLMLSFCIRLRQTGDQVLHGVRIGCVGRCSGGDDVDVLAIGFRDPRHGACRLGGISNVEDAVQLDVYMFGGLFVPPRF